MLTWHGDFALVAGVGPAGLLEAVVEGLMPCDDPAGCESAQPLGELKQLGSAAGLAVLVRRSAEALSAASAAELEAGLEAFEGEAKLRFGAGFLALDPASRQASFEAVERGATRATWPVAPSAWFERLVCWAAEARYASLGDDDPKRVWDSLGYARFESRAQSRAGGSALRHRA